MTAGSPHARERPIACVVSDCAYSDAGEILAYKLKKLYGLPRFPFLNAAAFFTRYLLGYDPREISPEAAVARSRTPVMIIHGSADSFVPADMARRLYAASAAEKKDLLIVDDAGHAEAYRIAGASYADRTAAFVGSALA
jgi:hypothetical protein